jgi:hypothetical protein
MANAGEEIEVQGEGDYEATRRYRARTETFSAKGKVRKAAARAAPRTGAKRKTWRRRGSRKEACEG